MKCCYESSATATLSPASCDKEATRFFLTNESYLIVNFRMKIIGFISVCEDHARILDIQGHNKSEVMKEEYETALLMKS